MTSKRGFCDFRPIIENPGRDVNVSPVAKLIWRCLAGCVGEVSRGLPARLAEDYPRRIPPCLAEHIAEGCVFLSMGQIPSAGVVGKLDQLLCVTTEDPV